MNLSNIEQNALDGIKKAFEEELRCALEERLKSFLEEIRCEYMKEIEITVDAVSKRVDLVFYKDLALPLGQPFLRWILNDTERTSKHDYEQI